MSTLFLLNIGRFIEREREILVSFGKIFIQLKVPEIFTFSSV